MFKILIYNKKKKKRFRKKFPEETSQFALFVETSKTFLRLDDESIIGSIENLKDGVSFKKEFKMNIIFLLVFKKTLV